MEIKWGIIWGLWASLLFWGFQSKVFGSECTAEPAQVAFSAKFNLFNTEMAVKVGPTQKTGPSEMVADIYEGDVCKATCRVKTYPQSGAPQEAATDFSCNGAFSAPATLFWSPNAPAIRFGTWLDGYKRVSIEKVSENPTLLAALTGNTDFDRIPASQAKSKWTP